ncbi:MAG: LysR family transcriptional regulator [Lachnospiraceae bacterium]
MITLTQFHYFLVAADEQNFTKAAKRLYISQQSLSMHIQSVEKELGTKLFFRTVPLKLTPSGKIFQKYAGSIVHSYQEMCREINDVNNHQEGVYPFGISHSCGELLLPLLLPDLQREFPSVDFRVVEDTCDILQKKLLGGEVELIIEQLPFHDDKIVEIPLCRDRICLLVSEGFLRRNFGENTSAILEKLYDTGHIIPEIAGSPFLLYNPGNSIRTRVETVLQLEKIEAECRIAVDNTEALLNLCADGCGITFCPQCFLQTVQGDRTPSNVFVVPLKYAETGYTLGLGYRKDSYYSQIASRIEKRVRGYLEISH